jgi:hypothetical protein
LQGRREEVGAGGAGTPKIGAFNPKKSKLKSKKNIFTQIRSNTKRFWLSLVQGRREEVGAGGEYYRKRKKVKKIFAELGFSKKFFTRST